MRIWSASFQEGLPIPEQYALGKSHPTDHVQLAADLSPHLAWTELPPGTQSLVLTCHDRDAPSRRDDANKEGRLVPADLARVDFFHLVMVDLAATPGSFDEGELSRGVTPHGKTGPAGPRGTRVGLNDYTGWFKGDPAMDGQYFGYDGPCPPWNDSRIHHYAFNLYALDVPRTSVDGVFTGAQVRHSITGHVLAEATYGGTYTINPRAT